MYVQSNLIDMISFPGVPLIVAVTWALLIYCLDVEEYSNSRVRKTPQAKIFICLNFCCTWNHQTRPILQFRNLIWLCLSNMTNEGIFYPWNVIRMVTQNIWDREYLECGCMLFWWIQHAMVQIFAFIFEYLSQPCSPFDVTKCFKLLCGTIFCEKK